MKTSNTIWKLINDLSNKKGITEIAINDPSRVFVEKEGRFIQLKVDLLADDFLPFIQDVADLNKKTCDQKNPILDGNLVDGSRINVLLPPYSVGCPAITIRKYLNEFKSLESDTSIFGLDKSWVTFIQSIVRARMNIMVSGGTGAGKTTFLNLLINEISPDERIICIEDTVELQVKIPNVVRLDAGPKVFGEKYAGPNFRDLVRNALRMRPDRIIIGETRGPELFDLFQAMNTGHDGSMSTIHSNSTGDCFARMETLIMLTGLDVPITVVRKQIANSIDFIIQINRDRNGGRFISQITEITGMEGPNILSQNLAILDQGILKGTGVTPRSMARLNEFGNLPIDYFSKAIVRV